MQGWKMRDQAGMESHTHRDVVSVLVSKVIGTVQDRVSIVSK